MPLLLPNQQYQSTEGYYSLLSLMLLPCRLVQYSSRSEPVTDSPWMTGRNSLQSPSRHSSPCTVPTTSSVPCISTSSSDNYTTASTTFTSSAAFQTNPRKPVPSQFLSFAWSKQQLSSCWDGPPFGRNRHGPKIGGYCAPFCGGSWVPI